MVEEAEGERPCHRRGQQPCPREAIPGTYQARSDDRSGVDDDGDVGELPSGQGHEVLSRMGGRVRNVDNRRHDDHRRSQESYVSTHHSDLLLGIVSCVHSHG
jgi:hypothetical protein